MDMIGGSDEKLQDTIKYGGAQQTTALVQPSPAYMRMMDAPERIWFIFFPIFHLERVFSQTIKRNDEL